MESNLLNRLDAVYAMEGSSATPIAIDCSTNPNIPAYLLGTRLRVSVEGLLGGGAGQAVQVGDMVEYIATVPTAGDWATYGSYLVITEHNTEAATGAEIITGTNNTKYATAAGLKGALITTGYPSFKTDFIVGKTDTEKLRIGSTRPLLIQEGNPLSYGVTGTMVTTTPVTVTIAQLLLGNLTAAVAQNTTWTLPTAALAVAGVTGAVVGTRVKFRVINTAALNSGFAITIAAGANGTIVEPGLAGGFVLKEGVNPIGEFELEFTNVTGGTETYNIYASSNTNYAQNVTAATGVDGAAVVLTAAQLVGAHGKGSVIMGDPGVSTTWTLPAGAGLLTAIPNIKVGSTFEFTVINNSAVNTGYAITVTAGAQSTFVDTTRGGNFIVQEGKNPVMTYVGVITDAGTGAHTVYPKVSSLVNDRTVATAPGAGAAQTISAAAILGGLIVDDPEVVAATWTLDTAANVVAAMPNYVIGSSIEFTVINQATAGTGERITIAMPGSGTFVGSAAANELTLIEGINPTGRFKLVITSAATYDVYPLDSVVNTTVDLKTEMCAYSDAVDGAAPAITAAMMIGGILRGDPGGAAAWTMADAVDVVAAIPGCKVGTSFVVTCINAGTHGAAEAITIGAGAGGTRVDSEGGTVSYVITEGTNEIMSYRILITNIGTGTEAYSMFPMNHV